MFGVYVLSQICVVATYWAVFALGRSIVGAQHAALAGAADGRGRRLYGAHAGLRAGHPHHAAVGDHPVALWRAVGEGRGLLAAAAIEVGLLLLTTYVGLILVGLLVLFTLLNKRARSALNSYDPLIAAVVAASYGSASDLGRGFGRRPAADSASLAHARSRGRQSGGMAAANRIDLRGARGLIVLVALVAGWPWPRHDPAPVIVRREIDPFARQFVYFFAWRRLSPARSSAVLLGWAGPVGGIAPLVILSGLLVVVAAGDAIEFNRQRIVIAAWFGLLVIPPVMAVAALVVLPWLNIDLRVTYPGQGHGAVFLGKFRASHRCATGRGHRRSRHRRAGRARCSEPAERLSECDARALALGHGRYDQEQGCDRGLADHRYRRHAAAAIKERFPDLLFPRSRARSTARCRVGCRSCASAGL
jgi:hypothetical protein